MSTKEIVLHDTQATTTSKDIIQRITWTLRNFSEIPLEKKVVGPDFFLAPNFSCLCSLSLKKEKNDLLLFVKSESAVDFVRSDARLDDNYERIVHTFSPDMDFSLRPAQDKRMIESVKTIYDRLSHLPDDTLIFECGLKFTEIVTAETHRFPFEVKGSSKLVADFKTMLENPVLTDVSLRVGEAVVPAHRSMLSARSPCFRKMFETNMKERREGVVDITDLPSSIVRTLVGFLYTGVVEGVDEDSTLDKVCDLYEAADKYEVTDLGEICKAKLKSGCDVGSAIRIWMLADLHSDDDLRSHAQNFITCRSIAVQDSDDFKDLASNDPHHPLVILLGLGVKIER